MVTMCDIYERIYMMEFQMVNFVDVGAPFRHILFVRHLSSDKKNLKIPKG